MLLSTHVVSVARFPSVPEENQCFCPVRPKSVLCRVTEETPPHNPFLYPSPSPGGSSAPQLSLEFCFSRVVVSGRHRDGWDGWGRHGTP